MTNPYPSLPASVEQRLAGWARILEKQQGPLAKTRPHPTITISRQYGCEAFPVALRLLELLEGSTREEWTIFDRSLIDQVAEDEGISRKVLKDLGDETRALEAYGFHPRGAMTTDEAFAKMALFIGKVAVAGNAIVIGRGGAILCRDLPNAFHFRLWADLAWRTEAVMKRMNLAPKEAVHLVKTQARLRDQFIKDYLQADVEDPKYYDAAFNNERHSVDAIASAIFAYVRTGWAAEDWRQSPLTVGSRV
jgi:cytidylate kinase